jgi:hypothetical protein
MHFSVAKAAFLKVPDSSAKSTCLEVVSCKIVAQRRIVGVLLELTWSMMAHS